MFKNKKRNYLLLGLLVVVLIVVGIVSKKSGSSSFKVLTAKAELRDITESVSANGKIQPEKDLVINSDVAGQIVEMHVKEGQQVKQGDLLLRINPDLFESALSRSEAALNSARANLAAAKARLAQSDAQFIQARRSYERSENLHEQGAVSDAEFEQAEATYMGAQADKEAAAQSVEAAKYSVASAQATRNEAADNLKRTSIFAPRDGTVSALSRDQGESVLGTQQMQPTEIMRISDMSAMEVDVDVNESDIIRIAIGDTSLLEVDAYLDRKFKGVVTEVANAAKNVGGLSTDQVTNFSVKISVLRESYQDLVTESSKWPFRPGMSANVEILTNTGTGVLTVPIEAVTTRSDTLSKENRFDKTASATDKVNKEDIVCVFRLNNIKADLVPVETGIQDSRYIEIKSGLKEGDEVVRGPYDVVSRKLTNGAEVEKSTEKEVFKVDG